MPMRRVDRRRLFSRKVACAKHAPVVKATFPSRFIRLSKASVEHDVIAWAREFVESSSEVIEASLQLGR